MDIFIINLLNLSNQISKYWNLKKSFVQYLQYILSIVQDSLVRHILRFPNGKYYYKLNDLNYDHRNYTQFYKFFNNRKVQGINDSYFTITLFDAFTAEEIVTIVKNLKRRLSVDDWKQEYICQFLENEK